MHSAQAQSVRVKEKIFVRFVVHHCCGITRSKIECVFILVFESSPYVLSYRSMYSWENTVSYFSNVLIEILVTNGWKQSFAKLPIPKLSLYNSAVFYLWQKASQRFAWKFHILIPYTLASLNDTLSVSEYMKTNVTAKPVTFLHGTKYGCTVVSHMCSCNTLTVTRK